LDEVQKEWSQGAKQQTHLSTYSTIVPLNRIRPNLIQDF
jgi:hypothetical protein